MINVENFFDFFVFQLTLVAAIPILDSMRWCSIYFYLSIRIAAAMYFWCNYTGEGHWTLKYVLERKFNAGNIE